MPAPEINVGSTSPGTDGNVNAIAGHLVINGQSSSDTVNVYDKDAGPDSGTLTATTITGLEMGASGITYGTVETLNINLGTRSDTFTIESTHGAVTNLNSNGGSDIINVRTIAGTTTVSAGDDSDTINVGSLSPLVGGMVDSIAALLTVHGGTDQADGGNMEFDTLNVDDRGDTADNFGAILEHQLGMCPPCAARDPLDKDFGIFVDPDTHIV